ncbi:hypothetical protein [Streptomyces sp. NPDC001315]|uniref:hypothetical protein n=1 Tax=Streptomyces sp. NPDC001315 TaxID=3364562 RepID=UPI0036B48E3A
MLADAPSSPPPVVGAAGIVVVAGEPGGAAVVRRPGGDRTGLARAAPSGRPPRCEDAARTANEALLAPLSAVERDRFMDLLIRISGTAASGTAASGTAD